MSMLPPTGGSLGPGTPVYSEELTQHQLRALLAPVPPGGCLLGPLCADTDSRLPLVDSAELHPPAHRCLLLGPPGLHLFFQMIKHTVLRSSKPPLTPLPHRQESCVIYFMEQSTSLLLSSLPLSFPLSPSPSPSLFSFPLSFTSQALAPFLLFSLPLFVLLYSFLSRAPDEAL